VYGLRAVGVVGLIVVFWASFTTDPRPALSGEGLGVLIALAAAVVGIVVSIPRPELPQGMRFAALALVAAAGVALGALQPDGAAVGLILCAIATSAMRLTRTAAVLIAVFAVGGAAIADAFVADDPGAQILSLVLLTVPWFLIIRLMRELREVSAATVKSHVNHIFAKAGVRDRAQAVTYAYRHGLAG
jgi:hypothetical protein